MGERKGRIIDLARQMPTIGPVSSQKLSKADLAVLERDGDPRRLAAVRRDRLVALVVKFSHGRGDPRARPAGSVLRPARP